MWNGFTLFLTRNSCAYITSRAHQHKQRLGGADSPSRCHEKVSLDCSKRGCIRHLFIFSALSTADHGDPAPQFGEADRSTRTEAKLMYCWGQEGSCKMYFSHWSGLKKNQYQYTIFRIFSLLLSSCQTVLSSRELNEAGKLLSSEPTNPCDKNSDLPCRTGELLV